MAEKKKKESLKDNIKTPDTRFHYAKCWKNEKHKGLHFWTQNNCAFLCFHSRNHGKLCAKCFPTKAGNFSTIKPCERVPLLPAPLARTCHSPAPLGELNPKPDRSHSASWWLETREDIRLRIEERDVHLKDTRPALLKSHSKHASQCLHSFQHNIPDNSNVQNWEITKFNSF